VNIPRRFAPLVVCLAACAAAPAQAAAKTETATSGQVTATLTYAHDAKDSSYSDLHLVIQRGGSVALDQAVRSSDCADACWPGAGALDSKSVSVRDLNGDGEPEVVLDLFTGGAHCCLVTQVFALDGATYRLIEHNFADPGYTLKELNGDGVPEFSSGDYRFEYSLASYAGSFVPIQVWRFKDGGFADVTREFPKLIRADSKRHWRYYRKYIGRRAPYNDPGLGALAAWAGDEYLLGHGARVQSELRSALRRGWLNGGFTHGRGTIRALNRLLADSGYR
jgi:hypothetical protein